MFAAKLSEAGLLKKIMEAIKELLDEASLDCGENGIYLQAMDSSHVTLVSFLLKKNAFEEYRCDRNLSLGINMSSMSKIIKCSLSTDSVVLKANDEADTLKFIFESPIANKTSEFDMKLMNLDIEHMNIPDTDYSCVIKMPSSEFSKICKDLFTLGDAVTIDCSKKGVQFLTFGDLGNGSIRLKQSSTHDRPQDAITINLRKNVALTFSLRFLILFTKGAPLADQVTISMSDDVPLMVEYNILNGENISIGYVRFYLAPKVEDSEL